jgi:BolA family transcriptional regulator, general stress-responsive regulator
MSAVDRAGKIRACLLAQFNPIELEIEDESHRHAGHAGAAGGMGHFRIRIVSEAFGGLSAVARHRKIYGALGDLLKTDVHALAIDARAPGEQSR